MRVSAIKRRVVPSTVIALSQVTWPARARARVRRVLGKRGRVEVFYAFDDPCSAVAVLALEERVRDREVELVLRPVVERGIPNDPAVALKRRHALADARRLAARSGIRLGRSEPVDPAAVAHLAAWAATADELAGPIDALRALWLDGRPAPSVPAGDPSAVRGNEKRMRRVGPYDTPAAALGGRWYFAHDRLDQIEEWLDELGWTRTR